MYIFPRSLLGARFFALMVMWLTFENMPLKTTKFILYFARLHYFCNKLQNRLNAPIFVMHIKQPANNECNR